MDAISGTLEYEAAGTAWWPYAGPTFGLVAEERSSTSAVPGPYRRLMVLHMAYSGQLDISQETRSPRLGQQAETGMYKALSQL